MMSLSDVESDDENSVAWRYELQSHRMKIIEIVEYRKISTWLKTHFIFDQEDDEEVSNGLVYQTTKRKMDRVIDILLKKGERNYEKFLEGLSLFYPQLYTLITKKEAPEQPKGNPPDLVPRNMADTKDEVLQIVIERFEKKKQECNQLVKKTMMAQHDLDMKTRENSNLELQIEELKKRSEKYESMERDMGALKDAVNKEKHQRSILCMRLVDINENNSRLRERNMAMRIENDKMEAELKKMANTVNSERSVSTRLRNTIKNGPSQKVIMTLHQQIDELKLKLAQSNRAMIDVDSDVDTRIQILQTDKEEAIQMYAEATEKLNKLREEFNTTETLRDKYLEENEGLQLEVLALTDDCDMYKTRRDAVWQQLQEVEKERDQLMKERNEAQMTAQDHMDEKTKYRTEIRKLEERIDEKSHQLRETEMQLRELLKKDKGASRPPGEEKEELSPILPGDPSTATETSTSFVVKSEFDVTINPRSSEIGPDNTFPEIALAANYGNDCGKIGDHPRTKPRKPAVRRPKYSGSAMRKRNSEAQSRTSSTDSEQLRKQDEPTTVMVEIEAKTLRECVRFIGGNSSGIFVNQTVESQTCHAANTLQPGMQLMKVRQPQTKPHIVKDWTLEYTYDIIRNLDDTLVLMLQCKQKEYQDLKEKMKNSRMSGDSFYVRANFKWSHEGMLNFNKFEILHVVSTQPSTEMHWIACKIDPYNGNTASKCDVIPSLKYCTKNPHHTNIVPKMRCRSEPSLFSPIQPRETRIHPSSLRVPATKQSLAPLVLKPVVGNSNFEGQRLPGMNGIEMPYTVMQSVEMQKDKPRPCLFLPQSLSMILSYKLTTMASPLLFDFPPPESVNCSVNDARFRLYDRDVVSFNSLSEDMQEVVKTASVKKTADMGKHCILSINENYIGVREYLRELEKEDIYPVVVFLQTDNKKTTKMLLHEDEKNKANTVFQDMMLTGEQLKGFGLNFATANLDRCNKIEDAAQLVMEKIADEMSRIVWKEDECDLRF